jgi:hypothetical protein
MALEPGDTVWIPCDVTLGVFPDERNVRVDSAFGLFEGFVDVKQLRDDIEDGRTAIRATIVRAAPGKLGARLPGQTARRQYLTVTESL